MNSKLKRGFTLIELLVVIAIIGILSAVVLAALNTARTKGNDAAIKANLDTVRTQSAVYYDAHSNSYGATEQGVNCGVPAGQVGGLLTDSNVSRALSGAYAENGSQTNSFYCNVSSQNYAIALVLASGGYWCSDSTETAQSGNTTGAYTGLTTGANPALTNATDYTCN